LLTLYVVVMDALALNELVFERDADVEKELVAVDEGVWDMEHVCVALFASVMVSGDTVTVVVFIGLLVLLGVMVSPEYVSISVRLIVILTLPDSDEESLREIEGEFVTVGVLEAVGD
jgi:hypothetical protein